MAWGLIIGLWLALSALFVYQCFRLLSQGYKRDLGVFAGWSFLLGLLITAGLLFASPANPRFAEWVLSFFQGHT